MIRTPSRSCDGVVVSASARFHPSSFRLAPSPRAAYRDDRPELRIRDVMPRGEWDDNTWYDDGDFPPASRNEGRGGMVAASIFSFLMCAFNAVGSACFLSLSGFCALIAADN